MVSKFVLMAGGSVLETLKERVFRIEEVLGEWSGEDVTISMWVETMTNENYKSKGIWLNSMTSMWRIRL